MHIKDHSAAMKFFRTYDSAASKGKWKEFVDEMEFDSMVQEPRNMKLAKYIPRHEMDNMNTKDLEQSPDSFLKPGETLEDWDVTFRRPNAEGGVQQLVQNTVDGSRPGYDGDKGIKTAIEEIFETQTTFDSKSQLIDLLEDKLGYRPDPKGISPNRYSILENVKYESVLPVTTEEQLIETFGKEYLAEERAKGVSDKTLRDRRNHKIQFANLGASERAIKVEKTRQRNKNLSEEQILDRKEKAIVRRQISKGYDFYKVNKAESLLWNDLLRTAKNKEGYFTFKGEAPVSGKYYNKVATENFVLVDKKGNEFKYSTLSDDITKHSGEKLEDVLRPYKQKEFLAAEGLTKELNKLYGYEPGSNKSVFHTQHIEGIDKNPFKVHLTFGDQNIKEASFRKSFNADWKSATTLNDVGKKGDVNYKPGKKTAVKNYYKSLGPDIVAQIGKKPKGEIKTLINLLDKTGIKLTDTQRAGATALEAKIKELGGKEKLKQLLFKGGGTTAEKGLVQKIISGGGKMALGMLNPAELIKLKNLIGPGALGIMAAFEAGVVTDDVLRMGKPLNESLAANWLFKSFRPHSEEFEKQRNLLQSGKLNDSQRQYALEMMKIEQATKEFNRLEMMESTQLVDGAFDDNFTITSQEEINTAKQKLVERVGRIKESAFEEGTAKQLENKAAMVEKEATEMAKKKFSPLFGDSGTPLVNMAPRPENMGRGPMTEKKRMNLDFSIPGYTPYNKAYTLSDKEISDFYQTLEKPRALNPGEGTLIRMGMGGEGLYGTQDKFADGGLAGLMKKYYD